MTPSPVLADLPSTAAQKPGGVEGGGKVAQNHPKEKNGEHS